MDKNNLEIEKEMKIYSNKYKFENTNTNKYLLKDNKKLAKEIFHNLNKMNYNEKISYYKKILNESKINRELLRFEFYNYVPEKKILQFDNLIKNIESLLKRYHKMAGGFLLEDNEWKLHLNGTTKYDLKKNEAIFDNSIRDDNTNCNDTYNFIKQLTIIFSLLSDRYKARFKYIPDHEEKIHWIIIKISEKKHKN